LKLKYTPLAFFPDIIFVIEFPLQKRDRRDRMVVGLTTISAYQ